MKLSVIFKNKETQLEEVGELKIAREDIACLYQDKYGTYIVNCSGKSYRVTQTLKELEALVKSEG